MPVTVINGPVIEAGQALSDAVDCSAGKVVRITTPAEWTPAILTFQISSDGVGFNDLYRGANEVMLSIGPNRGLVVIAEEWPGLVYLKFRSGRSAHPVNQGARREFAVAVETAAETPPA